MFTKSDIESLRANGTTDREILQMTARVIPSASKALKDIDADKTTPDIQKNQIMRQMIDRNAKNSGPSMLPYVSALTVNSATKKSDALQASYEQQERGFLSKVGKGIVDYGTAPAEAAVGGILKGIGAVTGMDVSGMDEVKTLPENLSRSADVARVAIPIAAGIATGGASIPVSAAVSGAAGAGSSLLASGLEAAAGEEQTGKGAIGEAVTTGLTSAAIDAATMGLFKLAKPLLKAKGAADLSDDLSKTVGKVTQGSSDDIVKATKALKTLDTSAVNTYDDLTSVIDSRLNSIRTAQDEVLGTVQDIKPVSSFTRTVGQGKNAVQTNPVAAALDGLDELYTKTGAAEDLVRVRELKQLARKGLSAKQVNDIAREYGRGFKAFSDATGQPITSVNAKLYENVRKGIKQAARDMMPNDASRIMDEEMTNLLTTKKLTEKMSGAVQKLTNKLENRGILSTVASKIGGGVDLALGRTPSSLFTSLFVRGNIGAKQLNSAQLQSMLPKNLKLIETLADQIDSLPEGAVVGRLKEILGNAAEQGIKTAGKAAVGAVSSAFNE